MGDRGWTRGLAVAGGEDEGRRRIFVFIRVRASMACMGWIGYGGVRRRRMKYEMRRGGEEE